MLLIKQTGCPTRHIVAATSSRHAQWHLHLCSLVTHLRQHLRATAEYAVASTQISAAKSSAAQDAHVQEPAHWLCIGESRPPRSQTLHSRPPMPESDTSKIRCQLVTVVNKYDYTMVRTKSQLRLRVCSVES